MITKGAFIFTWLFSLNLLYYVILFIPEVQQALLVCGYSWLHSPRPGERSHELPVSSLEEQLEQLVCRRMRYNLLSGGVGLNLPGGPSTN